MTDLDKEIAKALDEEDRAMLAQFEEQGLMAQTFSVFKGKQGWIAMITVIVSLILFFIALYAAREFVGAETPLDKAHWGALAWGLLFSIGLIKIWFWIRMESNRVIREVKRIELQLARLQAKNGH